MAHFARVNEYNVVTYVTCVPNSEITDAEGNEIEQLGRNYLYLSIPDSVGDRWIQTSYNNNFRVRYAMIGGTYDENLDAFLEIKPGRSWVLNTETYKWEPPIPRPEMIKGGPRYRWCDEIENWKEFTN